MMTQACLIYYPTRQWWVVTPENKAQGKPQTITTSRGGGLKLTRKAAVQRLVTLTSCRVNGCVRN